MGSQDGGFVTVSLLAYSPGLVIACVHTWLLAIVHKPWWMVVVCLCMWVAVFICGWSASFFRQLWQQGRRELWLALGIVSWLSSAALLGCGWWLVEERNGCHTL